jgi:MFS superfamily sulfate permease-like transporter
LFSGIIAGIVGGIVVGLFSGSEVSVSGPAAGLAVIVAAGITTMGTFPAFCAAVLVSGLFQLAFGFAGGGRIGDYVPNSVIRGMLAAIGIVIVLKQIPHALGRDDDYEGDLAFIENAGANTFTDIAKAVLSSNGEAVLIAGLSILVLLAWDRKPIKGSPLAQWLPGPLVVVALGIAVNEFFRATFSGFYLRSEDGHLVTLPLANDVRAFAGNFSLPDFSVLRDSKTYILAATIAIVGSVESLLNVEAADKVDPARRISDTDRELKAQGIGNVVSGLLGGLPVTSVVVRTSANVYAGSRTRRSTIFHGVLMLCAVYFIPALLNKVPLASLAAILIMIGYKLAPPRLFRDMKQLGTDQFVPFIVTVVAIVFTDLLKGVAAGLACGIFFILRSNHHYSITVVHDGLDYLMQFNKDVSFVNKTELKQKLRRIPDGANLLIEGARAGYIDKDIYDVIADFQMAAEARRIKIQYKHFYEKARSLRRPKAA